MRVVLHHHATSSSWRVRWALAAKGIEFESVLVDLQGGAQRQSDFLGRNPMGRVPVLEMDGYVLAESVAIFEYLEEVRPDPPLYPRTPIERARVRQLVELVNSGIQPLQNTSAQRRHSPDRAEQVAFAATFNEWGLCALEALLRAFDAERGAVGRFAYGDRLTSADLYLVPQVASARRLGVAVDPYPRVLAAEASALATPAAARAHPDAWRSHS